MRYTNPLTRSLKWQKAWFFLPDDVQHVMVSNLSSTTNQTVFSVLDQRRNTGIIVIDGGKQPAKIASFQGSATSLWHGDVGYLFDSRNSATLNVEAGPKTGNWSVIGTSPQPPSTVNLFSAWLTHQNLSSPLAYTAFPGRSVHRFAKEIQGLTFDSIRNDGRVSAVFDKAKLTLMAVFWEVGTLQVGGPFGSWTVESTGNCALIYNVISGRVTISDPSQQLNVLNVTFRIDIGTPPRGWRKIGRERTLSFSLPSQGLAGSSVVKNLYQGL